MTEQLNLLKSNMITGEHNQLVEDLVETNETIKKPTHKQRILNLLSDGEWHSMRELNTICWRYSARLFDLKKDGIYHEIKKVDGVMFYKLKEQ